MHFPKRSSSSRRDRLQLLLQSSKIPLHRTLGKLSPSDHRILLQRPLDQSILTRLIEISNAAPITKIVPGLARRLNPMESRLKHVVRPRHEQVPDITDDRLSARFDFGPFVPYPEFSDHLAPRTDLQPTLPFLLKE